MAQTNTTNPIRVASLQTTADGLHLALDLMARIASFNRITPSSPAWPGMGGDVDALANANPDDVVQLRLPLDLLAVINAFVSIEKHIVLSPASSEAVVTRLAECLSTQRGQHRDGAISEVLSCAYECSVFLRFAMAGYFGEFLPRGTLQRPDVLFPADRLLLECKDGQSLKGYTGTLTSIAYWLRSKVDEARAQLQSEDPHRDYTHLICIDLPENAISHIIETDDLHREDFYRMALANVDDLSNYPDGVHGVILSSIDFNQNYPFEIGKENQLIPEVWIWPPLGSSLDPRLNEVRHRLSTSHGTLVELP